jgi:uncharacterized LabA/DUF88 family protein
LKNVVAFVDLALILATTPSNGAKTRLYTTVKNILDGACAEDESISRTYIYDCAPYGGLKDNPVTGKEEDFRETEQFANVTHSHLTLSRVSGFIMREAPIIFHGWNVNGGRASPKFSTKAKSVLVVQDLMNLLLWKNPPDAILLLFGDGTLSPVIQQISRSGIEVIGANLRSYPMPDLVPSCDDTRKLMDDENGTWYIEAAFHED